LRYQRQCPAWLARRLCLVSMGLLAFVWPAAMGQAAGEDAAARAWISPDGASRAGFRLDTFWHGVEGTTSTLSARVISPGGNPLVDGQVEVAIDAASLVTGSRRRDRKMREDYLETGRYPSIRFVSRSNPRKIIESVDSVFVEVHGDLTLHGVTQKTTAQVEALRQADGWMMKSHFVVRLSEFQIKNPGTFLNKVDDEVDIYFEIQLVTE
jgi:polyisoprenoid-binding protein YceI